VFTLVGVVTVVVGTVWHPKGEGRPLGLTILSINYAIGGILSLVLAVLSFDVFLFTSLAVLSLVIFALVYLILRGSFYGLIGVALLTFLGLVGSLLGVGNGGMVNVPGVLVAAFILWYLYRPHVAKYFRQEGWQVNLKMKHLVLALILAVAVLIPVSYYYAYPPSRTISMQMAESGGPSGGASSTDMTFAVGDVIHFSYSVTSKWPVTFSIGLSSDSALVKTGPGMSGSGSATVLVPGQYSVFYQPVGIPEASLDVKITVEMYSLRTAISQWTLLDLYAIFALSVQGLAAKRHEPQGLAKTQTGQPSRSMFGVDLFVAILIIASVTTALSVFQWFLWGAFTGFVQIENYMFYFSLPVGLDLAVAYALAKGYLAQGQGHIIAFGIAALVSGLLGAAIIWFDYVAPSLGPVVAVASVSGLLFSALNFFGAFQFRRQASSCPSSCGSRLAVAYAGGAVACALISYSALKVLGPFFYGPPRVGLHILPYEAFSLLAMVLLFASSILLFAKGIADPDARLVSWYAASLALAALLHVPFLLNLSSNGFTFLEGLTTLAVGACALIFAFVYLHKTRLNTVQQTR
jgi:hypothetical protein